MPISLDALMGFTKATLHSMAFVKSLIFPYSSALIESAIDRKTSVIKFKTSGTNGGSGSKHAVAEAGSEGCILAETFANVCIGDLGLSVAAVVGNDDCCDDEGGTGGVVAWLVVIDGSDSSGGRCCWQ